MASMNIPEDINTRAEAMWRIISQKIDFRGKRVIDLGCGGGEMLWRAYVAGAKKVLGVDKENKLDKLFHADFLSFLCEDINTDKDAVLLIASDYDIALCFSVLPYLGDIPATFKWMSDNFPLCLIEAQYEPEPYNVGVSEDSEMYSLLRNNGFKCATWLGQTYVEDRDTHRSIWACSKGNLRL